MATRPNKRPQGTTEPKKTVPVCCMDCKHSCLMQYGNNPVLADCLQKPQPGNDRFPYQREVARAMRICAMHRHTDETKTIEKRAA